MIYYIANCQLCGHFSQAPDILSEYNNKFTTCETLSVENRRSSAMDDSLEEPWGLLVKEGGEDERVPVLGKEFTIGRSKGDASLNYCYYTNLCA